MAPDEDELFPGPALRAPMDAAVDLRAAPSPPLNLRLDFDGSDWSQRVEPPPPARSPALSPQSPLPPSSPSLGGATVFAAPPLVRRTLVVTHARRRAAGRARRRALREDLGCTHLRYGECMRHFFTRTT